jgi:hypothetical protein
MEPTAAMNNERIIANFLAFPEHQETAKTIILSRICLGNKWAARRLLQEIAMLSNKIITEDSIRISSRSRKLDQKLIEKKNLLLAMMGQPNLNRHGLIATHSIPARTRSPASPSSFLLYRLSLLTSEC